MATTTKINKNETTRRILELGTQMECIKLELQNIVFPKWSDLGMLGMMFRQYVSTKEQPTGNHYDEDAFQTVLRIIGGKVLMSGRPDCYCWKFSKVESAKDVKVIGTNSSEGILSLCSVLNTIPDEEEKKMLADMFTSMKKDLLLVTTPAENRQCIEVTQELYNLGVTSCVDEWMEVDQDGNAPATQLNIGDFLIVSENGIYRIGKEEFLETHNLLP